MASRNYAAQINDFSASLALRCQDEPNIVDKDAGSTFPRILHKLNAIYRGTLHVLLSPKDYFKWHLTYGGFLPMLLASLPLGFRPPLEAALVRERQPFPLERTRRDKSLGDLDSP